MRSRSGDAKQLVLEVTRQVAAVAEAQLADADRIVAGARRARGRGAGRRTALVDALQTTIQRTRRLLDQARTRLAGGMPAGSSRLVSLHDPDARPIRKGRIGRPVEFGYKAQVADNPQGVVVDHAVMLGNPPDAPLLVPAIGRVIQQTGRAPGAVTADRGYGEAGVERDVAALGVAQVAIPRKGRAGPARQAVERGRGFRRLGGPHQPAQAPLRLGPHPAGRPPGCPALVWPWGACSQPRQGRRAADGQATQASAPTVSLGPIAILDPRPLDGHFPPKEFFMAK
jgi:IS5 family transposase